MLRSGFEEPDYVVAQACSGRRRRQRRQRSASRVDARGELSNTLAMLSARLETCIA